MGTRPPVTLLDANALLAFLFGEPGESEVAALLGSGDCVTPAPCLAEVVDRLIRRAGIPPEEVVDRLDPLIEASLGIAPIENTVGWQAGEYRAVYYSRRSADLSMADAILLACVGPEDRLASSDRTVLRVADELGFELIPLPDSSGRRPELG